MTNAGGTADGEAQLELEDTELRLPWLESADEDGEDGLDWARIGKFAGILAGVALVAAVGIWLLRDWQLAPPEGDGSIIAAPEQPWRVKPESPGGKEFAGTGDTSYMVGEGIERDARLASKGAAAPAATPALGEKAATGTPAPAASASPATAPAPAPPISGVAVQVGAYMSEAAARTGWTTLTGRYARLGDFDRRIVEGRADIGTVFRLQAIAGSASAAFALCEELRANGIECQVKR